MFLTDNPKAMNPRLSTNEKAITKRRNSETKSKTLLIYIKKRIGKTEDLYKIPISFSVSLISCLLIIIRNFRLVRKDLVYTTKFMLIPSSIMYLKS